ncbi:MAG: hypothetical protein HS115_15120 [Spirochaetales bacterium]|nr:hypothetical protein [Spirochaetales bacterium]
MDLPAPGSFVFTPGNGRIEIKAAFLAARDAFRKHWVLGCVATIAVQFISFGISIVMQIFQAAGTLIQPEAGAAGAGVAGLVSLFVSPAIAVGPLYIALNAVDSMHNSSVTVAFEQVFIGFKRFWTIFAAYWLMGLVAALPLIIGGAGIAGYLYAVTTFARTPELNEILVAAALGIPALGVFFYLILRIYFAFYFVLDQQTGALEGIRRSWLVTENQVGALLGLALAFMGLFLLLLIPWLLVSILTCGVGFLAIFGLTFFYGLVNATAYRMLVPLPQSAGSQAQGGTPGGLEFGAEQRFPEEKNPYQAG